MPYRSRAQQGYLHAAAARGDVPRKVVKDFDQATTSKQYAALPEHVEKDSRGGLAGRLAHKYFGGAKVGADRAHDERIEQAEDDFGACQHYSHGGVSDRHDPECSHLSGGGFAGDDSDEDVDQPEEEFEADMREDTGLRPSGLLLQLAEGGEAEGGEAEAEGPGLMDSMKRWYAAKPGSDERHQAGQDVARSVGTLMPGFTPQKTTPKKGIHAFDNQYARGGRVKRYAQGGEAEESSMHMQGDGWQDDERNSPRSPLATRLAGARVSQSVLSRLLRARGPKAQ